jgi:hypothetical protein
MTPAPGALRLSGPVAVVLIAAVVVAGMTVGWLLEPVHGRNFAQVKVFISPIAIGVMCIARLLDRRRHQHSRWRVPIMVGLVMLTVLTLLTVFSQPHIPALTALGAGAGVVAIATSLGGLERTGSVSALVCSATVLTSMAAGAP